MEPLEDLDDEAPVDDHGDDDDGQGGAEDHLPAVTDCVPVVQGELEGGRNSFWH